VVALRWPYPATTRGKKFREPCHGQAQCTRQQTPSKRIGNHNLLPTAVIIELVEGMAAPTKAGLRSLAGLETHSENVHRNPQQSIMNYLATIAQYTGIEIMNGPDLGGFGGMG
jgi:hypothetical protein